MTKHTISTIKQMAGSWARAALSAALAYYMATGDMDLKAIGSAALASVIPPIYRYLNPKDSLGR
jgi:hypothetical protein